MTTPFFHMALGLLTGILLTSAQSPLPVKIVWAALMVGCYALHLQPRDNRLFARTTLTTFGIGVILHLLNLGFGGGNAGLPESLRSQRLTLYGTIDAPVEGNRKTDRLYLALNRAEWRGRSVPLSGRARLTVYQKGVSVQYGDRVRIRNVRLHHPRGFQNPGSFDYETYLAVRGIVAVGAVSRLSQIATLKGGALSLRSELYDFRKRLIQTVRAGLPAPESQVLNAILFGERRDIPSEIRSAFRDSGAGHLLAISGLHVGFVAVFLHQVLFWTVQWIPRRIRVSLPAFLIPARAATLGVLPLVLAYMVIAGARVSTVRATVMVGAYLVARFLQRERNHFNTLGLAAILILLWDPRFLFDTGFQLSFVAVLVILACLREFNQGNRIQDFLRITVLVSTAMIPILAFHFHRVSLYGIAANVALIPLASLLVPAGLTASLLGTLSPPAAKIFFFPVHLLMVPLMETARWFADLPQAVFRVRPPTPLMLLALYSLGAAWVGLRARGRSWWVAAAAPLALFVGATLWNAYATSNLKERDSLRITFLDVGDADATFVRLPDGRNFLVDAAGKLSDSFDVGEAVVLPYLEKQWIRKLDYALLTHPERDHAGGLIPILKTMPVGQLWESGLLSSNSLRLRVLQTAKEREVQIRAVRRGARLFGRGFRIEVLHPHPLRKYAGFRQDNDQSVVLRIVHGKMRILLAADLEKRGERELVRSGQDLSAEIVRVPHHGSRTSSSNAFLRRVRPRVAVISAGRPWRGHPSPRVIRRYADWSARIFRTDRDGAIHLRSDGETYLVSGTRPSAHRFEARAGTAAFTRLAPEDLAQD